MNAYVATACLPSQDQTLPSGSPCWLAGWGNKRKGWRHTEDDFPHYNRESLRETDLPILDNEECKGPGFLNFSLFVKLCRIFSYNSFEYHDKSFTLENVFYSPDLADIAKKFF